MKTCGKCKQIKSELDFHFKSKSTGKRNSFCKICINKNNKKYYKKNKEKHKKAVSIRRDKYKEELKLKLYNILNINTCIICGEADPIVLEFDHRNSKDKEFNISNAIRNGYSWHRIQQEIEKCDILCANCHKRKTAKEQNWFKYRSTSISMFC